MNLLENRFLNRVLHKTLWAVLLPLCAMWAAGQAVSSGLATRASGGDAATRGALPAGMSVAELPRDWHGAPLRPLALSEVEARFARHFPGSVARMTDGTQMLVLRTVNRPTRMLHPATDCYRGLGYRVRDEQLEAHGDHLLWRCFLAERGARLLRVCERIEDAQGQGFTDPSAWYWAAISGRSTGPWKATTVATVP